MRLYDFAMNGAILTRGRIRLRKTGLVIFGAVVWWSRVRNHGCKQVATAGVDRAPGGQVGSVAPVGYHRSQSVRHDGVVSLCECLSCITNAGL
jgi:hypothetical protein